MKIKLENWKEEEEEPMERKKKTHEIFQFFFSIVGLLGNWFAFHYGSDKENLNVKKYINIFNVFSICK